MTRRRRPSLAVRCAQGIATPLLLAVVAFTTDGAWHLLQWVMAQ